VRDYKNGAKHYVTRFAPNEYPKEEKTKRPSPTLRMAAYAFPGSVVSPAAFGTTLYPWTMGMQVVGLVAGCENWR